MHLLSGIEILWNLEYSIDARGYPCKCRKSFTYLDTDVGEEPRRILGVGPAVIIRSATRTVTTLPSQLPKVNNTIRQLLVGLGNTTKSVDLRFPR